MRDGRPAGALILAWARRPVAVGLVGAVLLVAGVGTYLAMIRPPYATDEAAHVGYTLSLLERELPTIDTPVPTAGGGPELRAALKRPPPSTPDVHVANNPPFTYLLSIPAAELSRWSGIPGGALLGVRMVDLLGAMGAVGCAFLLGRELTGGDCFAGLVTAGLVAGVISVPVVSSLAALDGPAMCATTGVSWALARFARTRAASHATQLGVWCAVAAAVRPMSLAFAAVAGSVALTLGLRALGMEGAVRLVLRLGAPTAVLTGWFYALNVRRYGDVTGSAVLFDKFNMTPRGGFWGALSGPGSLVQPLAYLVTQVYGRNPWWVRTGLDKWAITVGAGGLLAGSVVWAARSRTTISRQPGSLPPPLLAGWISVSLLAVVPVALVAEHLSGGGGGHPRYLLPMLPILAAALALLTSRVSRWLSLLAVVGFTLATLTRVRAAGHLGLASGSGTTPLLGSPILGPPWRYLSLLAAGVGAVVLVGSLWLLARGGKPAEGVKADGAAKTDLTVDVRGLRGKSQCPLRRWATDRPCGTVAGGDRTPSRWSPPSVDPSTRTWEGPRGG